MDDLVWDKSAGRWVERPAQPVSTAPTFQWDESLDRWTRSVIHSQRWRVQKQYTDNDLYQECWLKFLIIRSKYTVDSQEHGMSLYMRSVSNLFHDLARLDTRHSNVVTDVEMSDGGRAPIYDVLPSHTPRQDEVELRIELEEASPPFRGLLEHADWNTCATRRLRKHRRGADGVRETTNHLLCRLAGVDDDRYDLHTELLTLLNG